MLQPEILTQKARNRPPYDAHDAGLPLQGGHRKHGYTSFRLRRWLGPQFVFLFDGLCVFATCGKGVLPMPHSDKEVRKVLLTTAPQRGSQRIAHLIRDIRELSRSEVPRLSETQACVRAAAAAPRAFGGSSGLCDTEGLAELVVPVEPTGADR